MSDRQRPKLQVSVVIVSQLTGALQTITRPIDNARLWPLCRHTTGQRICLLYTDYRRRHLDGKRTVCSSLRSLKPL